MDTLALNLCKPLGPIKPMHAVNNGPVHKKGSQARSNLLEYRAAGIPYVRNHDASFCADYGGEHTVDIYAVFPDFDADPLEPESYDFAVTDRYLQTIEETGAKTFYRLGSKIEHGVKKYGTLPPKDFHKWAVICEHIIRHYTAGWADGFHMDIEYWEIWNEPDLDADDAANKRNWGGTAKEFYELYAIAATHLKNCFPHLKIGGPALAGAWNEKWQTGFFDRLTRDERIPLDFLSWHLYTVNPRHFMESAAKIREILDRYGYTETESILNEWNYVKDWGTNFPKTIETIIGMKGAAFTAACMCEGQNSNADMLMYYDARPCVFNGLFDFYTCRPLKGYYPFKMFHKLYQKGTQISCETSAADIYAIGAVDDSGNAAVLISYYTDEENMPAKTLQLQFNGLKQKTIRQYLLDKTHDNEMTGTLDAVAAEIHLQPNTVLLLTSED